MRFLRRHNENISGFADMFHTVYGELTDAFDHMNHRIAGRIVRADLLTLENANNVKLTALFWARVLLTICPGAAVI